MRILALDPATSCGWAINSVIGADPISGTWDLSPARDESKGMRLIRLKGKLNEMLRSEQKIDLVVFEAARHAAMHMQGALVVQAELQGVIKVWCEENKIEYRGYSPSEIKKFATGKGNADKEKMTEAARRRWPNHQIGTSDEADALHVLDMAEKGYQPAPPKARKSKKPKAE